MLLSGRLLAIHVLSDHRMDGVLQLDDCALTLLLFDDEGSGLVAVAVIKV